MDSPAFDYDIIVIGGGPAGSVLACLLAGSGWRVMVFERDIHPREHVGESLTPAANIVWQRIGFRNKIEEAGFIHKPGAAWTAPRAPIGRHLAIRLNEAPCPDCPPPHYTYNVERDAFDALLLRHAHEQGATVLQGVRVTRVHFENGRAVGVRATVADGWQRDLRARFVVDASGRRCVLASQLGLKRKDPAFNQFAVYSWFTGVAPHPPGTEGMILLHFLDLERSWVWQIPLRNGITSVGVVTDKVDFAGAGQDRQQFFVSMMARNNSLRHNLRDAQSIRPYRIQADYSYKINKLTGPGWLLLGDALRFVDPIFSTGVDVAVFSALYAFEAVDACLRGGDEATLLPAYEHRVTGGIDVWYDLIALFYELRNLFTFYAVNPATRKRVVGVLQGNPYAPDSLDRARSLIDVLRASRDRVHATPNHLFRPGRLLGAPVGSATCGGNGFRA
ncbi:NAD(P)/FAD-dependent oxidoreductase [Mycobacterium heidelbergense]|uniref:NAD(P)/FAD-dependent oxidoreductase n=1 Tax=Mycobacterium heidelbergense TaxID=53376 RepID=UPI003CEB5463